MTPAIAATIREWAEKMVPDEAARKWLYEGGALGSDAVKSVKAATTEEVAAPKDAFPVSAE